MKKNKNRWGALLLFAALLFVSSSIYIAQSYRDFEHTLFYELILPVSGLCFSVILILLGNFSYPRLHDLKVYFAGYLAGFLGLNCFLSSGNLLSDFIQNPSSNYFTVILITNFLNFLILPFIPSSVKYKLARSTVLAFLVVETVVLIVMRTGNNALVWVDFLKFDNITNSTFWIGAAVFVAGTLLSIGRLKDDFYFGGLTSGYLFIFSMIWSLGIGDGRDESTQMFLFWSAQLFLILSIGIHWFFKVEHRLMYDPLLKIYNRDFCSKIISEQSKISGGVPLSVAMVDIDHFKQVNDTYGHQVGDQVLYTVAQGVAGSVSNHGVVCRYGGEELVVFFPKKTSKEVVPIMESVRENIEKIKTECGSKQIAVTVSCGVSHREIESQSVADIIEAADKALYKAKHGGRNQVKIGKIVAR